MTTSRAQRALSWALVLGSCLAAGCASRGDVDQARQEATRSSAATRSEVQAFQQSAEQSQRAALDASAAHRRSIGTMLKDSAAARASAEKTARSIEILKGTRNP